MLVRAETACPFCGQAMYIPPQVRTSEGMVRGLEILVEVCGEHGVSMNDLVGPSKQTLLVNARRCAAQRLRSELYLPLKAIGYLLGHRDHSTIINLIQNTPSKLVC